MGLPHSEAGPGRSRPLVPQPGNAARGRRRGRPSRGGATAGAANGRGERRQGGGSPARRRAGAGWRRGRRAAGRAQDEGGHCWGSAAGRRTLRRRRAAQRCGGGARAVAGPMARTTSQLVSARRPSGRAGPSPSQARRPPGPGEAGRPRVPRAGRRLTCGRAAGPGTTGFVRALLGRHEEPGPRRDGRLPGGGADRRAEGGGGWEGVTGLSRWKCSESLFSARRGLELSLWGSLSFRLRRNLPGPSPGTGSHCLYRSEAGGTSSCSEHLMLQASRKFTVRVGSGSLLSRPGGAALGAFPALGLFSSSDIECVKPLGGRT